jgi:hypothetical protein
MVASCCRLAGVPTAQGRRPVCDEELSCLACAAAVSLASRRLAIVQLVISFPLVLL